MILDRLSMIISKPTLKNDVLILVGIMILTAASFGCQRKNPLPDPLLAGWKNQPVSEILQDNDDLRVLKCTFPPG